MTKEEIRYLLKRYRHIQTAMKRNLVAAFFPVSGRKERIAITDDIKKFSNAVLMALEKVKDDFSRDILSHSVLEGKSDVYIFTHYSITRGTYYSIKESFLDRLFCLCILKGLVNEEEI